MKVKLYFRRYHRSKIIKVNSIDEIRPIAENFVLMQELKRHNTAYNSMKILCEVTFVDTNEQKSIYVTPEIHFRWKNLMTEQCFSNKRECIKNFIYELFTKGKICIYQSQIDKKPFKKER